MQLSRSLPLIILLVRRVQYKAEFLKDGQIVSPYRQANQRPASVRATCGAKFLSRMTPRGSGMSDADYTAQEIKRMPRPMSRSGLPITSTLTQRAKPQFAFGRKNSAAHLGMLQSFAEQRRAFEEGIMKSHLQLLKNDPEPSRDTDAPIPSFEEVETRFENLREHFTHNAVVNRLTPDQQKSLCRTMWKRCVGAGQVVIPEGGMGNMCYIIRSGRYEVFKKGKADALCSYDQPGQSFGELALLYRRPRAAQVKAVTDGELWVIDRMSFSKVMFEQKRRISVAVPKIQDKVS
jgi:CRP-like cAMP-binding protein